MKINKMKLYDLKKKIEDRPDDNSVYSKQIKKRIQLLSPKKIREKLLK
jgi:hypothetical protein